MNNILPGSFGDGEKQYSILIAGATGKIGRELVVLAVNSPHVKRIVGLSRQEIPADKWTAVFPGIDMAKADGKLKMVAVNWVDLHKNNHELAGHEVKWATKKEGDLDLSASNNPVPLQQRPDWARHDIAIQAMGCTNGNATEQQNVDFHFTRAFIVGAIQCNASAGQVVASAISEVADVAGGLFGKISSAVGSAVSHAADGATAALSNTSVGLNHFAQVSADGADPGGLTDYRKIKGQTDVFLQSHFSHNVVRSKAVYRPKWDFLCCSGTPTATVAAAVLNNAVQQCMQPPPIPGQQPQAAPGEPAHGGGSSATERVLPATFVYGEDQIKNLAAPSGKVQ